ncbi:MAG: wax ester/triacylglycerol synthase family O-acyltransferase [Acidimicrobiia bacterium]
MAHFERLSPADAQFLYQETPTAHMHVGGLVVFDDTGFTLEDVMVHTESRMALVPRFRQKLMWVPYGQGRPVWIDDADFDIRYHVRHTGLPRPGGERELLALVGRIMSVQLDRKRPLWEMWIIDLPEGRRAMIHKTHHAVIDGMSGVDLASVLLDLAPEGRDIGKADVETRESPTKTALLRETLVERATQPAEAWRAFARATAGPREFLARAREVGTGVMSFGKAPFQVAPKTSLSQRNGQHRRYAVVRTDLADVKTIKNRAGSTVNDVVLALVTGGLRHLLLSRGDVVDDVVMRCSVPVSVRDESDRMSMGNKVAVMFAELPVGERDLDARLDHIKAHMGKAKEGKQALGADAIMRLADYAPPTLLSLAGRVVANQWVMNLTVTNVPGPQFPLYFMGGAIHEIMPMVPLVGETNVGVACLSYDGALNFGLTGDWDAVPDLDIFAEGIEKTLADYLR